MEGSCCSTLPVPDPRFCTEKMHFRGSFEEGMSKHLQLHQDAVETIYTMSNSTAKRVKSQIGCTIVPTLGCSISLIGSLPWQMSLAGRGADGEGSYAPQS